MNTRKGFTLPELLIVLLVLGILVGIAFMVRGPVLSSARTTAWDASMTTLTHALNNAAMVNNDKFATFTNTTPGTADPFATFANLVVVTSTSQKLADYLDKVPKNPWNKSDLLVADSALEAVALDGTGTPTISYETTLDASHFKITYITSKGPFSIFDSMSAATAAIAGETAPVTLAIGDSYQGGKIAYIDGSGEHGLIAAPSDQSTGDDIVWWNGSYTTTGATGTAIGTGNANTNTIVASQGAGSYAAKLCADLVLGGYSDWYLPSKDELNQLCLNQTAVGGFAMADYWSSSESDASSAWNEFFLEYSPSVYYKNRTTRVRAVRAF